MYPGQRNSLDALCKRLGVLNSHRELHGALLDSEILADVYLYMTGGQDALDLSAAEEAGGVLLGGNIIKKERANLMVQKATDDELSEHLMRCEQIKIDNGQCLWLEKTPNG
jgi:DNA polymerase-3 subunit epsilon